MTSEVDALKTNEFLRRRKLRLQQVREQSKDIARKIRLRAKVEQLRQIVNLETKKEQDHIQNQDKLVKELEKLYTKGVQNVGAGHSRASEVNLDSVSKTDPSRLRGREAAALLRQEKQQKLDERKKSLDRKLQAREAANELSREKSKSITNQLLQKTSGIKGCDKTNKTGFEDLIPTKDTDNQINENNLNKKDNAASTEHIQAVKKNDMATQWTCESSAGEWEPDVPKLILSDENITGPKEPTDGNPQNKSGREKRIDLFALSEDMPLSLQAKTTYVAPINTEPVKSSLTLISEYLQNRNLRLREPEITKSGKHSDDLPSLKQTILRMRASKTEVSSKADKNIKPNIPESTTSRKSAVTVYNHSSRDSRNIPGSEDYLVIREETPDEDAYSQAMKESSSVTVKEKEHDKKLQDMRNKVAMTKQTVEKEYKDTMAFLSSLPKEKTCRTQKRAFMNERRQEQLNENRQLKMEQEFRRIQNDYKLLEQCCADRRNNNKPDKRKSKPKSPATENFAAQDFEYSWMPVPESDASLAIHTIPTAVKEGKSSTVKFSNVDSYHEYRSRHKHTPPTKDTNATEEKGRKRETIILQEDGDESTDYSTVASESSSVENLEKENDARKDSNCDNSDAERIIIYKIIDSKADKGKRKKKSKLSDNVTEVSAKKIHKILKRKDDSKKDYATSAMSVQQLREGVYKTVSEKGDNIASMYFDGENQDSIEDGRLDVSSCGCASTGPPVPMQWDSGDVPARKTSISSKPCKSCGQKTEQKLASIHLPTRPSQAASSETSTNTYKTAVVGKTKNEDDFLKLIDMAGQDAGKFYIGATGLLNNEGYEVVIQLRKKDAAKDEKQNDKETINESVVTTAVDDPAKTYEQNVPASAMVNAAKDLNENPDKMSKTISPLPLDKPKLDDNGSSCSLEMNVINYEENGGQNIYTAAGDLENNDALTSEPIRKTSTSTYTQTTLNTPQRPVYVHMSSSTSTTYMSPPEIIPPEYLKSHVENQNLMLGKTKKSGCKCRKCNARRNSESTKNNVRPSARSNPDKPRFLETPPNSKNSSDRRIYYESSGDGNKEESSHSSLVPMRRYKTRKLSQQRIRSKDSRHSVFYKKHASKDSRSAKIQANINPVIQNYVKRLLTLSNEGFKAIEVINQECSSVATPGSSIINIECNVKNKRNTSLVNKISLEQLREVLQKKVYEKDDKNTTKADHKKKPVHKVKSLNISRHLQRKKRSCEIKTMNDRKIEKQTSSSTKEQSDKKDMSSVRKPKPRSKSSPTPRPVVNVETCAKSSLSDNTSNSTSALEKRANNLLKLHNKEESIKIIHSLKSMSRSSTMPFQNTTDTSSSTYLSNTKQHKHRNYNRVKKQNLAQDPMSISTQTCASVDSDINIIKLAESKIQNMEKIADLTEKCTQRIFNLGKVLEEVRKNRSNAYSHITTSDSSETELKSNKNIAIKSTSPSQDIELDKLSKTEEEKSTPEISLHFPKVDEKLEEPEGFVSLLEGIPKLGTCLPSTSKPVLDKICFDGKTNRRPPPALSRIHLKHGEDEMIPHELSTVIEVDSPMSVKLKSKSRNGISFPSRQLDQSTENKSKESPEMEQQNDLTPQKTKGIFVNPDLLQNNVKILKSQSKLRNLSHGSKMEMMDLQKFKEIMLKPFVSIEEFAKQCNVGVLEEGSNVEDIPRDSAVNDDLSSLHSEGSLPDVIGELLKRNIISEPFKFDTASNVNSATVSSDSSLSVLALAKMVRDGKKSSELAKNKENIAETSDAMSISSNPDLENAFKQLGMGWASSTLKKTKERLALSSSSNTSSSSISRKYKLKSFDNKDDSCETSKKPLQGINDNKTSKTVDQQTSLSNSMIVQEFLNNELAKRITFSKSHRNETETEFVSLYETKLPDQMKNTSNVVREERSIDSVANPNRARTSTPVQLYKSMTYHSSSSSNNASNGFFSNLDELSSVKGTSGSMRNHSTTDKDDLTIPNYSLRKRRDLSDLSKSDS